MKLKINIHFIFVMLAACLWGTAGLFVRTLQTTPITQIQTVFGRTFFSALVLGIIILIKDISLFKIKLKDLWLFISAGLFSIVLFNFSYYMTMSLTSLSVASVLLYTAPFFVVIISIPLFNEKLNSNKVTACITAFIGCCLVSGLLDSSHRISGKALFFGLLTGFGYALYTIFGELLLKRDYKTLTITFYVFLFAAVCCIPFTNIVETVSFMISTPKALVTLFLMAVFNTVIPYLFYTSGLAGVDPSVAPIIATLEPVVATVIGGVVYKEHISFWGVLGILLVLASVVILNLKKTVTLKANAKINLTLGILGKREDGYHLIDTVMQSVSLSDTVTISKSKKIKVKYSNKNIDRDNNMAVKSARLFFEETGIKSGAHITVKNRIPTSSGMGGGSADSAAVLMGLDKLYGTNLKAEKLEAMAVSLGADVPFFIKGGTQRAEGIGEILTPVAPLSKGYFILAKNDSKPSTAEMYKRLDSENPALPQTETLLKILENGDLKTLPDYFVNSFASVWKNSETERILKNTEADGVSLSGSGPTWFAYFTDKTKAKEAYRAIKSQKIECYFAKPETKGIEFE